MSATENIYFEIPGIWYIYFEVYMENLKDQPPGGRRTSFSQHGFLYTLMACNILGVL